MPVMNTQHLVCPPRGRRTLWSFAGIGAAGALLAGFRTARAGGWPDGWAIAGSLAAVAGVWCLYQLTCLVRADAQGVYVRTLLGRRLVPWHDIAELRLRVKHRGRRPDLRRVVLVLRDGRRRTLPRPTSDYPDFAGQLAALRGLLRRYGTPASDRLRVVTDDAVGSGWSGRLGVSVLLLVAAGVAAWSVSGAVAHERAWRTAAPCVVGSTSDDCLRTVPAVIERTDPRGPKQQSWIYFADGRPMTREGVSSEAAEAFRAGDRVELTVWRGEVMKVAGTHYVWHEHVITGGSVAAFAAGLVLAAGYPGAQVLLRLRWRRQPEDEVLPSVLPFTGALLGTGVWLLPLCYRYPTGLTDSAPAIGWVAAGSLASVALFAWAWRRTRVPTPGQSPAPTAPERGDVFLAARFLEETDYNPHRFGTHVVLGEGGPAVTPHAGPGRFAARRIPVERLTVTTVRRPRGDDGDTVPRSWHIAELDDAGTPVRLAAAPDDLTRILRALQPAHA
jgi:hypothetical protein